MRKLSANFKEKSVKELEKEITKLREEIAKLRVESKVNQPKDTNLLFKKRKQLAQILTILTEKKELEKLKI